MLKRDRAAPAADRDAMAVDPQPADAVASDPAPKPPPPMTIIESFQTLRDAITCLSELPGLCIQLGLRERLPPPQTSQKDSASKLDRRQAIGGVCMGRGWVYESLWREKGTMMIMIILYVSLL